MYNRYIPQPDGSYRRSRVESHKPSPPPQKPRPPQGPDCPPPPCPPPCEPPPCSPKEKPCKHSQSAGSFLRNILPRDLDTGDLIVILLLLLLAGDCEEDRSNALLTLVLYLFI